MIQKRFQYITPDGTVWTNWFNYSDSDELLPVFQKNEKYQLLHPKLLNEFRVV